jgi:hypothetical protein
MKAPSDLIAKLDAIRAGTLRRLEPLTQTELDWHPPASDGEAAWSLGEVFLHLALDEHYLREQIARPLLEGIKPPEGVTFLPPPPSYGAKKEVIQFWFDRARTITRRLLAELPPGANLDMKHVGGLEAMNGLEWFEGYAGHEAFHHRQIDTLIAQVRSVGV